MNFNYMSVNIEAGKDREWIEKQYLPNLKGTILYVGVAEYTHHYESLAKNSTEFYTLDYEEVSNNCKSSTKHFKMNFLDLPDDQKFDNISLYGLFGIGHSWTNDLDVIDRIHEKATRHLNKGGTLMLGPRWRSMTWGSETEDIILKMFDKDFLNDFKLIELSKLGSNIIYYGRLS